MIAFLPSPDPIMEVAAFYREHDGRSAFMQAALAYGDRASIEWARRVESLILGNWDVRILGVCYECWRASARCSHFTNEEVLEAHGLLWALPFVRAAPTGRTRE